MKMRDLFLITAILGCFAIAAQEPNAIKVPLTDPSRPVNLKVSLTSGSITVRGYDGNEVVVEGSSETGSHNRPSPESASGLRRIGPGDSGLRIEEQDNNVEISASPASSTTTVIIQVPRATSAHLRVENGGITVENLEGEIDANTTNGDLTLQNLSGSVIGHSLNGKIVATFDSVPVGKPMSFTSLNGDIDVTLPANIQARFKMKSDNSDIYTDFEMELGTGPADQPTRTADGRYRIRMDSTAYATVNGGGPDYQFTTMNGAILIRKK